MPEFYHIPAYNADEAHEHVFIAIPVTGGFPARVAASLWEYSRAFERVGMAADLCVLSGDCHVDDARNGLVRKFLETGAQTFVFIDADVATAPANIIRLVRHNRDVVAGLYPYKTDDGGFPVLTMGAHVAPEPDGLVEVENVPTGFLKIRRHVLEDLAREAPKFYGKAEPRGTGKPIPRIFGRTHVAWGEQPEQGGEWWQFGVFGDQYGGDYWFCRQWKAKGGKIFADPNFMMSHIGEKEWSGCVGAWWRQQSGLTHIEFDEMTRRLIAGQTGGDIFERWRQSYFNATWAPAAEFVEACYHVASEAKGPIIECGSGLTTLALAIGAKESGQTVYAIEHDPGFYATTLNLLETYDLKVNVILSLRPIEESVNVKTQTRHKWYDEPIMRPVGAKFAAAVIDGPPRALADRTAFFPILGGYLAPRCRLMIDDMNDRALAQQMIDHCSALGFETSLFKTSKAFMIAKRNDNEDENETEAARRVA